MDAGEHGGVAQAVGFGDAERAAPTREYTPLALGSRGFRRLFHSSGHGMVIVDDNRRYLAVNDAAARLFGLDPNRIVGRRIDDFTVSELRPVLPVMWAEFLQAGTLAGPYEIRVGSRRTKLEFSATANVAPGRHLAILLALPQEHDSDGAGDPGIQPRSGTLTAREREVLALLANGMRADEAATELGVARNTIQNHLRSARGKLGARTRAHAIALAIARGEIPVERDH